MPQFFNLLEETAELHRAAGSSIFRFTGLLMCNLIKDGLSKGLESAMSHTRKIPDGEEIHDSHMHSSSKNHHAISC